jgi:hypothetical protein
VRLRAKFFTLRVAPRTSFVAGWFTGDGGLSAACVTNWTAKHQGHVTVVSPVGAPKEPWHFVQLTGIAMLGGWGWV